MTRAKIRLHPELEGLSRSTWEMLIREANLGTEYEEIARRYFIGKECQIDIAIDKNADRTRISRAVNTIQRDILNTYRNYIKN